MVTESLRDALLSVRNAHPETPNERDRTDAMYQCAEEGHDDAIVLAHPETS